MVGSGPTGRPLADIRGEPLAPWADMRLRRAAEGPGRCWGLGEPLGLRPAERARVTGGRRASELHEFVRVMREVEHFLVGNGANAPLLHGQRAELPIARRGRSSARTGLCLFPGLLLEVLPCQIGPDQTHKRTGGAA